MDAAETIPIWQRNAAGSVSAIHRATVASTGLSLQGIVGSDYRLTDNLAVTLKFLWLRAGRLAAEFPRDVVRSHVPVLADGFTPCVLKLTSGPIDVVALTAGLKYSL